MVQFDPETSPRVPQLACSTDAVVVQRAVVRFLCFRLPTGSDTVAAIVTSWPVKMPLFSGGGRKVRFDIGDVERGYAPRVVLGDITAGGHRVGDIDRYGRMAEGTWIGRSPDQLHCIRCASVNIQWVWREQQLTRVTARVRRV